MHNVGTAISEDSSNLRIKDEIEKNTPSKPTMMTNEMYILNIVKNVLQKLALPLSSRYIAKEAQYVFNTPKKGICVIPGSFAWNQNIWFILLFGNTLKSSEIKGEKYYHIKETLYVTALDSFNYAIGIVKGIYRGDKLCVRDDEQYYVTVYFVGKDAYEWREKISNKALAIVGKESIKMAKSDNYVQTLIDGGNRCRQIKAKSLSEIIIPSSVKKDVMNKIYRFLKSEDLYSKYNIPYKLGIFIYGEPGTGKSSFAYALAKKMRKEVFIVSRNDIVNKKYFGDFNDKYMVIYLIEEIDNIINSKISTNNTEGRIAPTSISKDILLDYLDNIPDNTIIIATSNKKKMSDNTSDKVYEGIEKAILRPGRFDIHFEMGLFDKHEAIKMIKKYDLPESFADQFNYPIIPSEVQFECNQEVMRMSLEK